MTIAEQENLTRELTQDGKCILEPGYLGYLRGMGYQIDSVEDIDTVPSDSDDEKKYLVAELQTFKKPKDHPRLDYAADRITLRVCTCWSWRSQSAKIKDGENPSECGTCKHLKAWKREERAEADDKQVTL